MQVQSRIAQKLTEAFAPQHLEVLNESYMHSVPPNSETHFKVIVVSEEFTGDRKVARHQRVYKVLEDELKGPVHALALHIYSPVEWAARVGKVPDSPDCRGGSKSDGGRGGNLDGY